MMDDDDVLLAPGVVLRQIWTPTLPAFSVTRTAEQGLNATHVKEVLMLADALGTNDAALLTATLLRAHGNAGSAAAVEQWKPHVERALRRRGGRREP